MSYSLFAAWLVSAVSTAGSLFFSEVMLYPPCVLCWYQRICMYPLVALLAIGFLRLDKSAVTYSLPLVIIGWGISFYHNLLYYKLIPESAGPCQKGISCTTVFIEWFGFVTIPFLACLGFTLIFILLLLAQRKSP